MLGGADVVHRVEAFKFDPVVRAKSLWPREFIQVRITPEIRCVAYVDARKAACRCQRCEAR